MRAETEVGAAAPENASEQAVGGTSTSCVGGGTVERPAFLPDEKNVVSISDFDGRNDDEEKDFKLLYLRSEMLRAEALLKDFWAEEANRKLRIGLIQKDVKLFELRRLLQLQSEASTLAPALTSTSSQTESTDTTASSQETQTDFNEKNTDVAGDSPSATRTEDIDNDTDAVFEKVEVLEESSTDATTTEVDLNHNTEKDESENECRDIDDIEEEVDFMSKIAMRFKALDDKMDEAKYPAADETKLEEETEVQGDGDTDNSICDEGDADGRNNASAGDVGIAEEGEEDDAYMDALDTSVSSEATKARNGQAQTRPQTKAAKPDKRKKRVTGGGTSTLYSTFKPPLLKNNKRQRRRR